MNVGGGEAADQLVRMLLSGTEVSVRLGGSALKNLLVLTMTPEQYKQFARLAKKQKILFSAIQDKDDRGKLIDVILPVTELDRANMIFERLAYMPREHQPERSAPQRAQEAPGEPQQERSRRRAGRNRASPSGPRTGRRRRGSPHRLARRR